MERMIKVVGGLRQPVPTVGWGDIACLLYRYQSTDLMPEQVVKMKAENAAYKSTGLTPEQVADMKKAVSETVGLLSSLVGDPRTRSQMNNYIIRTIRRVISALMPEEE